MLDSQAYHVYLHYLCLINNVFLCFTYWCFVMLGFMHQLEATLRAFRPHVGRPRVPRDATGSDLGWSVQVSRVRGWLVTSWDSLNSMAVRLVTGWYCLIADGITDGYLCQESFGYSILVGTGNVTNSLFNTGWQWWRILLKASYWW